MIERECKSVPLQKIYTRMRAFFFYSQNQRHNTRAEARRRRPRSGVAKRGRAEPCSHSHSGLSSHYCIRVVPVSYTSFYWHAEADLLYLKHVFSRRRDSTHPCQASSRPSRRKELAENHVGLPCQLTFTSTAKNRSLETMQSEAVNKWPQL